MARGGINMGISEVNVNIGFKILPFGHAQIVIKGQEPRKKKLEQPVKYIEPMTTNIQTIEIGFGGEEYKSPKTTSGFQ